MSIMAVLMKSLPNAATSGRPGTSSATSLSGEFTGKNKKIEAELGVQSKETPDTSGSESGPERFGELLASLIASLTNQSPTQKSEPADVPSPTGPDASVPGLGAVEIDASNSFALDLSFSPSAGLQRLQALQASLHSALDEVVADIDGIGQALHDAVVDAIEEAGTTHAHPQIDMSSKLSTSASLSIGQGDINLEADINLNNELQTTTHSVPGESEGVPTIPSPSTGSAMNEPDAGPQVDQVPKVSQGPQQVHANQSNSSSASFAGSASFIQNQSGDERLSVESHLDTTFSNILSTSLENVTRPESVATASSTNNSPQAPVVHEQLVQTIAPLRNRANGTYDMTLELHPGELGAIRVRAVLENGSVRLHLTAEQMATHDLLKNSLAGLRNSLSDAGVNTSELSLNAHADWQSQTNHSDHQQSNAGAQASFSINTQASTDEVPSQDQSTSDTALDVML